MDTFASEIKTLIEAGDVALMSGNSLKVLLVQKVQSHSTELEYSSEAISEVFLNLTDLIVSGNLSRMPEDVLKVYLVLAILNQSKRSLPRLASRLMELTGISEEIALREALAALKTRGYIESVDEPVLKVAKRTKSGGPNGMELFA